MNSTVSLFAVYSPCSATELNWTHVVHFTEWIKIEAVGATTDTLTDRQTDAGDCLTCPMLCYCNRTVWQKGV